MMSADDESQLEDINSNSILDSFTNVQTNKVNSAFGLTQDSVKPQFTIPTINNASSTQNPVNFFRGFDNKPLGKDIKEPAKIPDILSKPTETNKNPIQFTDLNAKSSNESLAQKYQLNRPVGSSLTSPASINPLLTNISPSAFQPPSALNQKSNTNLLTSITTPSVSSGPTIAPPISVPLAQVTPSTTTPTTSTISSPPLSTTTTAPNVFSPPTTSTTIATPTPPPVSASPQTGPPTGNTKQTSNPYSARGHLNKKIYEPIQSVPVQPVNAIKLVQDVPSASNNLYVPPPTTSTSFPPPTATTEISQGPPINTTPTFTPQFNEQTNSQSTYPSYTPPIPSYPPTQQPDINQFNTQSSIPIQQMSAMNLDSSSKQSQKNIWNWITQNRLVTTLKTGVESVITTIDPQMRTYIQNDSQHFYIVNTSTDKVVSDLIRESFNYVGFIRNTVYEYNISPTTLFALQIVGHANALQAVQEKIANARQQLQQDCLIVATQDFLAELTQNCWYDQTCVMLRDTLNQIDIVFYTEAIPVPTELVQQLQQKTYANYAQKSSGFSSRLSDNSPVDWYEMLYGIHRKNLFSNTLKSVVSAYRAKIINSLSHN